MSEVKVATVYFWFLIWFCITTYWSIKEDKTKKEVISRYIISFSTSQIFLFVGIGTGIVK